MILSDSAIRSAIKAYDDSGGMDVLDTLKIAPFNDDQLQAASYDVRLHRYFRVFDHHAQPVVDVTRRTVNLTRAVEMDENGQFTLHPGEFALASTIECFEFGNNLVGRLEGKSSLGRLGLIVHATAGYFDPGFRGHATLELHNLLRVPIVLQFEMLVAQMSFLVVHGRVDNPYEGKYQDQSAAPQESEYWRNYVKPKW